MAKPIGARNKKTITREALIKEGIAAAQAAGIDGMEPLSAKRIAKMSMIEIMVYATIQAAIENRWADAAELASKVAPYRHAKLSQVTTDTTIRRSISELTDDELAALAGEGEGESGDSEAE